MLLAAGYLFYGWWDVRFLFLIACSTTVDFSIGLLLADKYMSTRQRLTASLFLAAAALFFLCPNWSAMAISSRGGDMTAWLTPRSIGLQVLAGTMLLGGLWHGAAWNYVLWGADQGALLCGHRFLMHGRETLPTSGDPVTGTTDIHGGALRPPILFPRWISTPLRTS